MTELAKQIGGYQIKKYLCAACGETKLGEPPHCCGLDDINDYKDGQYVPDVMVYVCDECWPNIRRNKKV